MSSSLVVHREGDQWRQAHAAVGDWPFKRICSLTLRFDQGVVSELLSGSLELNLRQIRALAARFGVAPAAFLRDR